MRTRRLGSSGLEVTVVGLGCNNFGGRIDEAVEAGSQVLHYDTPSFSKARSRRLIVA